ncbi:MAG: ABC transporter substrate-binding protein [Hyphomicrobiaceae bacterium]|nr:ABC transporter substrate-binding protein [Hyphomicrobiaceae bacterium]
MRLNWLSKPIAGAALAAAIMASAVTGPAVAQGTLRIGMTANDIPLTWGQPDNGFEGFRFVGLQLYDALINFDLANPDKPSGLIPGLAVSWSVDPSDKTKWTFKLRQGVKFHDGSEFDADAVVFNIEKLFNKSSPQYSARQGSLVNFRMPGFKSVTKIDKYTVQFQTKTPDSFFPYQICYFLMASPTQWAKTKDWTKFALAPSGTGPFKFAKSTARERLELVPFKAHWDKTRVPKLERVILLPLPDPSARTAALLSGQVDWIEAPAPDAIPRIKQQGMNIVFGLYPHVWPWHFSRVEGSPWNDERIRKAANLAIDREGIKQLLGGYAIPATGHVPKGDPWYGTPKFEIKRDLAAAKKLMKEAGFGPDKPVKVKMAISASGSGQMLPLQMNEYIQQNLAEIGIKVEFDVVEWQALLDIWRAGAKAPQAKGAHGVNVSYTTQDPYSAFTRFMRSDLHAPNGVNFGYYSDPEMDKLLKAAQLEFDPAKRDALLAKVHTKEVDEALFLWVVHDVAPRALSPKVMGFKPARNWFQSLSTTYMAK